MYAAKEDNVVLVSLDLKPRSVKYLQLVSETKVSELLHKGVRKKSMPHRFIMQKTGTGLVQ